jgi:8-oxo-dGTP pyrophosphatase MutT (NUDIX family)
MIHREVLIHVRRGDNFLVAHRSPDGGAFWHAIAGGVEPGEEWKEAARRELREETGLDTQALEVLGRFSYTPEAWEGSDGKPVEVRAFLVDVALDWEPELNEEHDDYRWCSRKDATELLFWPEPADLLRALS